MTWTLHSHWRATAPYRVRIGLALKGLPYDYAGVDLAAGEQREPAFRAVNPQGLTPALDIGGKVMTQSLAILEWLEEEHPEPPLLPTDRLERQTVRTLALVVACDIHPLNNARVLRVLRRDFRLPGDAVRQWAHRWISDGFDALEPAVAAHGRGFAFGATPTMADCCLIPQVYAAQRHELDLAPWPAIRAVAERCAEHPAFQAAHPDRQPDAESHA
ncbi:MAG: maleylacetoacetate isomerase [Phenylobacterium sp.]